MILSDLDIKKFIESKDIVITPFDESMIKPGSYTFTLNNRISIPKKVECIDANADRIEYEEIIIDDSGYVIKPGEFLLAQTKETLSISQKLACILDARTSLARIGLNFLQGSTFVEPGQEESHETLEVSNISGSSIRIYPGMKAVKGVFFLLSSVSEQNYAEMGTYIRQSKPDAILE